MAVMNTSAITGAGAASGVAPRSTADVVASVLLWVAALLVLPGYVVVGLAFLMFIDYCPPATCSVDNAMGAVVAGVVAAFVAFVASALTGIVRLARRRRAWPFALAGLGAVVVFCAAGLFVGFAAVGW